MQDLVHPTVRLPEEPVPVALTVIAPTMGTQTPLVFGSSAWNGEIRPTQSFQLNLQNIRDPWALVDTNSATAMVPNPKQALDHHLGR